MIRKANPDDRKIVALLIVQAMGDLAFKFANSNNIHDAIALFEYFFSQQGNQYSYENTLVFENDGQVVGSINAYDGAKLLELRAPFLQYLIKNCGLKDFNPEPETEAGEFYLDTISVSENMQGKGIGKLLIKAGIEWSAKLGHKKAALLVDKGNEGALRLYLKMGFEIENERQFIGGQYYHMIYNNQEPV
ncbi:GNAT family N-acetyltransferase [Pedobacter punctiformis]|uniref:GNAT family N-acetyltransferase n=1 Tax=Pedobacter punctiformis TaxID=3004097 RepID=A0ABT4L8G0_9SPHI|nr:GNAT family N-acetyltransferase [Pedobacter sp. HCMS5-2]MCZ4244209.1 GNAT family N-acetyltransferase [Pedobacter sp. HCMS5-2]